MKFKQTMVSLSVAGALLVMSGSAAASGFALIEQSASGMGNAFAGGAAIADDASTVFFNPAGMSRLSGKQIAITAHAITPSAKYTSAAGVPSGGDAGGTAIVPNGYFVMEVNPALRFGLGVNAPFGLQTEYDANWVGKQQAIKSKLETVNVNPSLSYQVNDKLSIGGGLDYQHIKGELSQDQGGAIGVAVINGSDSTWGYNLGALYQVDSTTRIGVAYRSTMSYTLSGSVATSLPFANGPVSLNIKLPDSLSISGFHQYSDKWDVMADVTFTGWSSFKQVKIVDGTGVTISNTPENWKDTVRVAVGATYHYNQHWLARAGLAYDQAPVSDEFRTARIPDNSRTWLSFGGQYKPSVTSAIDVGYSHLFLRDSSINSPTPAPALVGTYKNAVDILSVQYTYSF
ncbi:membrane protein involved in aromatic hydrocarbon degradation [Rhodoferax ferrireducens T118]|uniref:Membrane protein involved in aromatic hydrocarbon degradation n=1 Tax=Albidiferax ferrireducens (strain ATCC BAA-621 / DSM 15236 / T118) TaxID=338969 RepID=Q21UY2_ALBFT|nr:outer membrane protein transport protein [Rhodoferax ferrireducens]ABD70421.1 membrane protein involved in aromatic hydrocarbon degradation [Rhodoferax ferrireducens T118]